MLCTRPCSQCCGLYQDKSYRVPGFGELTIRITHIWLALFPLQGSFQVSYIITQAGCSLRHAGTSAARLAEGGGWWTTTSSSRGWSGRTAEDRGLGPEAPALWRSPGRLPLQRGWMQAALAWQFHHQTALLQSPALSLITSMILGKLLNFRAPQSLWQREMIVFLPELI